MSPFLILQLLILCQVLFADQAHNIAVRLDKILNQPKSMELLENIIVLPYFIKTCVSSKYYQNNKEAKELTKKRFDHLQTSKGKNYVKNRQLSDAKFEEEDNLRIRWSVKYSDGIKIEYKARDLDGEFLVYEERTINCDEL